MKCEPIIEYIRCVIEEIENLDDCKKQSYYERIASINDRMTNPYLNVALIGDFSTGKSTFINGLIQHDILKTAWLATTAIPTHIYYSDCETISMIVNTSDGQAYNLSSIRGRTELSKFLNVELSSDTKEMLNILSTNNELSQFISHIDIECPSNQLLKDICIIDTPGVNPGADEAKEHIEKTRNVLREYADATIVLFQAQKVYTKSFEDFLLENAKHFMDNAVFVVTMMDVVDETEREEILEFAKDRLKCSFNLSDPLVLGCCAKYVNYTDVDEENKHWCTEFDELRKTIIEYINARRQIIVENQISLLLYDLIEDVDTDISDNIYIISQQIKILEENSIDNLKNDISDWREVYEQALNSLFNTEQFSNEYDNLFSRILDKAKASINACTKIRGTNKDSISGYLKNHLSNDISAEQVVFTDQINQSLSKVSEILEEYAKENDDLFSIYSINLNNNVSNNSENGLSVTNNEVGGISYTGDTEFMGLVEGVGLIACGIALIPVIALDVLLGTNFSDDIAGVIDSFTGAVVNLFGNLYAKRIEAITSVEKSLKEACDKNRKTFLDGIDKRKKDAYDSLENTEKYYFELYENMYSQRKTEFEKEKIELENKIDKYQVFRDQLARYLSIINERV